MPTTRNIDLDSFLVLTQSPGRGLCGLWAMRYRPAKEAGR